MNILYSDRNVMNPKSLLTATVLSVFVLGVAGAASPAAATYLGNVGPNGETGAHSLEAALKIQQDRVLAVEDCPQCGSGTPYLDADGIAGASIIAGAVFGGVAATFFIRGRSGRYAAMGRG